MNNFNFMLKLDDLVDHFYDRDGIIMDNDARFKALFRDAIKEYDKLGDILLHFENFLAKMKVIQMHLSLNKSGLKSDMKIAEDHKFYCDSDEAIFGKAHESLNNQYADFLKAFLVRINRIERLLSHSEDESYEEKEMPEKLPLKIKDAAYFEKEFIKKHLNI